MFKALMAGAVAIGLIVAPTAAGAMSTHKTDKMHNTHKMHHAAQKNKMAPGTTTGMSSGTATEKSTGGAKAK
jgi:hypothetical protein